MDKLNFDFGAIDFGAKMVLAILFAGTIAGCESASPIATLPGAGEAVESVSSENSLSVELLSAAKASDNDNEFNGAKVALEVALDGPGIEFSERLWQDYDYTFNTDATLTGFTEDMKSVKLLKSNGVDIVVEIDILSKEDKEYLGEIPQRQRELLVD